MDAFKPLYFNNRLISCIITTSLIRQLLDKSINFQITHVITFLLLTHACLIIPKGDLCTHSTKFGGLPRQPFLRKQVVARMYSKMVYAVDMGTWW